MTTRQSDHKDFVERIKASRKEQGFQMAGANNSGIWLYWENLYINGASPRFVVGDQATYDLCDDKTIEEFVDACATKIIQFLDEK